MSFLSLLLLFQLLLQLFLRNQVAENYKQRIQRAWSTPIHQLSDEYAISES